VGERNGEEGGLTATFSARSSSDWVVGAARRFRITMGNLPVGAVNRELCDWFSGGSKTNAYNSAKHPVWGVKITKLRNGDKLRKEVL
jgi:hypothetical protein